MGFFRDLLNKIRGREMITSGNNETHKYNELPNIMDTYNVNTSPKVHGKSIREQELDKALEMAKSGIKVSNFKKDFNELNIVDLYTCENLAVSLKEGRVGRKDLLEVGGEDILFARMIEQANKNAEGNPWDYADEYKFMYVPNGKSMVEYIKRENREKELAAEKEKYKESFSLPKTMKRTSTLNQLYNSAIEGIGPYSTYINEQDLLKLASERGGTEIIVGGEEPYVEQVDIVATLRLANQVTLGNITREEIKRVGGPSKVIAEMSTLAKMAAKENQYIQSEAPKFLNSPKDVISQMPIIPERLYTVDGKM